MENDQNDTSRDEQPAPLELEDLEPADVQGGMQSLQGLGQNLA